MQWKMSVSKCLKILFLAVLVGGMAVMFGCGDDKDDSGDSDTTVIPDVKTGALPLTGGNEVLWHWKYSDCRDGSCELLGCNTPDSNLYNEADYTEDDESVIADACVVSREGDIEYTSEGMKIYVNQDWNSAVGIPFNRFVLESESEISINALVKIPEDSDVIVRPGFDASNTQAGGAGFEMTGRFANTYYLDEPKGRWFVVSFSPDSRDICSGFGEGCGLEAEVPEDMTYIAPWIQFMGGWDCNGDCDPIGGGGYVYIREIYIVGKRAEYCKINMSTVNDAHIWGFSSGAPCTTDLYECEDNWYTIRDEDTPTFFYAAKGTISVMNIKIAASENWCQPNGDHPVLNGVELTDDVGNNQGGWNFQFSVGENCEITP